MRSWRSLQKRRAAVTMACASFAVLKSDENTRHETPRPDPTARHQTTTPYPTARQPTDLTHSPPQDNHQTLPPHYHQALDHDHIKPSYITITHPYRRTTMQHKTIPSDHNTTRPHDHTSLIPEEALQPPTMIRNVTLAQHVRMHVLQRSMSMQIHT